MRAGMTVCAVGIALGGGCGRGAPPAPATEDARAAPPAVPASIAAMADVEAPTRALADALNDFALVARRGRVDQAVGNLFADHVAGTPFPSAPEAPVAVGAGVARRAWTLPTAREALPRARLVASLRALLAHFDELADARAYIDASSPGAEAIDAAVRLELYGRAADGAREVVSISATLSGRHDETLGWRVHAFEVAAVESVVATREMFSEVSERAGVGHKYVRPPRDPLYGMGAAVADVDNDGDIDIAAVAQDEMFLYENRGDGTFRDIASRVGATLGVADQLATCPVFVDYDNDGDVDLFVAQFGAPQVLFENRLVPDGQLAFRDVSEVAGVDVVVTAYSAAAGDVNGDGFTDLVLPGYGAFDSKRGSTAALSAATGDANVVLLNAGDGTFSTAAGAWRVPDTKWTMMAQLADLDGDRKPDLVVANHWGGGVDVWRNRGAGFTRSIALDSRALPTGLAVGDATGDGVLDIVVAGLSSRSGERMLDRIDPADAPWVARARGFLGGTAVFVGQGGGAFARATGPDASPPAGWAWGASLVDFDMDGRLDVWQPTGWFETGHLEDVSSRWWVPVIRAAIGPAGDPAEPVVVFEPTTDEHRGLEGLAVRWGQRDRLALRAADGYVDVSGVSGADSTRDARGAVYGDFDNDGDMDLFVRTTGPQQLHRLYRNELGAAGGFVRVRLEGRSGGRDAFGAVVRVKTPTGVQVRAHTALATTSAQSDPRMLFGLGGAAAADWLEVAWPWGATTRVPGPRAGQTVRVVEGAETAVVERVPVLSLPAPQTAEDRRWRHTSLAPNEPLPLTKVLDFAGKPSLLNPRLARRRGERTLLYFWNTGCAPCRDELPAVQALHAAGKRAKVAVIGITTNQRQELEDVPEYLATLGATFDVVVFPRFERDRVFPRAGVEVPLSVLVDHRGVVLDVFFGATPKHIAWLEQLAAGTER